MLFALGFVMERMIVTMAGMKAIANQVHGVVLKSSSAMAGSVSHLHGYVMVMLTVLIILMNTIVLGWFEYIIPISLLFLSNPLDFLCSTSLHPF